MPRSVARTCSSGPRLVHNLRRKAADLKNRSALQIPDKTFDMMAHTLSKMKVHPGMLMKTIKREFYICARCQAGEPDARAGRGMPRSVARTCSLGPRLVHNFRRRAADLKNRSALQIPDKTFNVMAHTLSKNEGSSGDVDENNQARVLRRCQVSGRGARRSGWARHAEKRSADLFFRSAACPQFATKSRGRKEQLRTTNPGQNVQYDGAFTIENEGSSGDIHENKGV